MKMTDAVHSTSSFTKTTWISPSALIRSAHLIERVGLAAMGGTSGLYVAAGLMHRGSELSGSGWVVLLMMLYGAISFYLGIDLPGRPARTSTSTERKEWHPGADAIEILSAAGIFLTAIATFVSVSIIILDENVPDGLLAWTGNGWVIGSSLQVAAGIIARSYGTAEDAGK
jgi:hypothetical protein